MSDVNQVSADGEEEQFSPHEMPSLPVGQWLRKNLFSNWARGILTLLGARAALAALRGGIELGIAQPPDHFLRRNL